MSTPIRICTFFLDGSFFGIDVRQVQEVIRYQELTRVPLAPRAVSGLINLHGQIVTVIDLRQRLGLPARTGDKLPANVIVRNDDVAVSLLVDEIGDVREVDSDAYEPVPPTLCGKARTLIQGAYKQPDGLLLILDTAEVLAETLVPHEASANTGRGLAQTSP